MTITATTFLETEYGTFAVSYHRNETDKCLTLSIGDVTSSAPLVRLHSACLFGEAFGGIDLGCQSQLSEALRCMASAGKGILVYLFQEGRGIGLEDEIHALELMRTEGR
jgi:3,4-dihydroxy 2-butanone 4-phosphate synthase/GTP cyclohydrolase II